MTQSLKANKKAVKTPSKVEVVLTDSHKLKYAEVVGLFSQSYDIGLKLEGLSLSKGQIEQQSAKGYVDMVQSSEMNYQEMQAFKKHVVESIATAKKQANVTIDKWLNKIVKTYLADADLKGYELPKAESKNAVAMSKLRSELANIDSDMLQAEIEASIKAEDFKRATQLATEKQKREKQEKNALVLAYKKSITELKNTIKNKITKVDSELQLAGLLWAIDNINEVVKIAKIEV
jgi:hypothetical protein